MRTSSARRSADARRLAQTSLLGRLRLPWELDLWWALAGYPLERPICPSESSNDNCTSYNIIFYSTWQIAQFASHWSVLITALATIAIGLFTYTLKKSTDRLWDAGERQLDHLEDTAQRQLRAYVSIDPRTVSNFGTTHTIVVGADARNHGLTPASNMSHVFLMGPLPNPLPNGFVFPEPYRRIATNNSLFPGSIVPVRYIDDRVLTAAEIAAINGNSQRFHIWGITRYEDAFGRERTTRFSASFGGPEFAQTTANAIAGILRPDGTAGPGWFWDWEHRHNEAT